MNQAINVYTSESRALATLEVSVHLNLNEDMPSDRFYPGDWDSKPPILETRFIGDDFVEENSAAVLRVVGCIVQQV